jgi:hypothetical protein
LRAPNARGSLPAVEQVKFIPSHIGYGFTVAGVFFIIHAEGFMQRPIALAGLLVSLGSIEAVFEIELSIGFAVTVFGMTSRDVSVRAIHFSILCR